MEEPGLILEENQSAVPDSLEGRSSFEIPPPDLDFLPSKDGTPLRPTLGMVLVGIGSLDGVAFTEEESSKGGGDGVRDPARSGLCTTAWGYAEAGQISTIDNLLKLRLEDGIDGEGDPKTSPAVATVPVVADDVEDGAFPVCAPLTGTSALLSRSTSPPAHDPTEEQGSADDVLCLDVPVSSPASIALVLADTACPGNGGLGPLSGLLSQQNSSFLMHCRDSSSVSCESLALGGGMVSEEVAVPPVVEEALRPQPTDGREPPVAVGRVVVGVSRCRQ
ncbi:hypothetical protein Dimus_030450 [Dionaea muscipula]